MLAIRTENLCKDFGGIKAIDDLSITFQPRKITGLIGPNGSGKTTLINLLTGTIPFDSGLVHIGEKTNLTKIKNTDLPEFGISRTFQDIRLFEQMSVLDNILIAVTTRGLIGSLIERHKPYHLEIAERVLKRVNLWGEIKSLAINLSYGQRKLLEIARVLAINEDLNIHTNFFDEPFAGLFPEMMITVEGVLNELKSQGKAVILVEHNMEIISELSDEVFVLDGGQILAQGIPKTVLKQKNVIEAYLGK